ncbi:GNAT family N-acetyltransferase [Sphingobacterium wenxiniae]|uniref:ElaA protein n=1 Tax=Sphingobacterium wenxiniae TaxID=683125 RepID=A0A1I6P6K1_9SPHI|nr:GNAT family N-acetyltransferase [Sphingobacterium wenxiniae]SFS35817.1 ElaA protein [Sphingobacterium wenxiniae]
MQQLIWTVKSFHELTALELYRILQLRITVFMLEQDCLYPECDDKDLKSQHLFAYTAEGVIAAYARLLPQNLSYTEVSIGRVVIDEGYRKYGLGKELMRRAIDYWDTQAPGEAIRISAQLYLQRFYEALGFQKVSEEYLEDDIPHIEMLKK